MAILRPDFNFFATTITQKRLLAAWQRVPGGWAAPASGLGMPSGVPSGFRFPAGVWLALGHVGGELCPPAVPVATPIPGQSGPRKCRRRPAHRWLERAVEDGRRRDRLPTRPCLATRGVRSGSCSCCCCCRPRARGETAAARGRRREPRRRARPGPGRPSRACGSS